MGLMLKRRLKDAGLPPIFSRCSRVPVINDLLSQNLQHLVGHTNPRTTQIHDRWGRRVTQTIVERTSVGVCKA